MSEGAIANDVPEPLAYSLSADMSARLRAQLARNRGARFAFPFIVFYALLQTTNWLLRVHLFGWNDPFVRVMPVAISAFVIIAVAVVSYRLRHVPTAMRPGVTTRAIFHDQTFEIERDDGTSPKTVLVRSVSSVSAISDAFFVTTKGSPLLVIPRVAFADGGDTFLRYFERRLVAPRMLRPSSPRTTIINTMAH